MKKIKWLQPAVVKNAVVWPDKCEASITTPQAVAWHQSRGDGTDCKLHAKIDYKGVKLCTRHASVRALQELAGPAPVVVSP